MELSIAFVVRVTAAVKDFKVRAVGTVRVTYRVTVNVLCLAL